jgi:hypothetical protein
MTYIKHVQRLFEVAEPAVVVTFLVVVFFTVQAQVPALLLRSYQWWGRGLKRRSRSSAGEGSCEGAGDNKDDNDVGCEESCCGGVESHGDLESGDGIESRGGVESCGGGRAVAAWRFVAA